MKPDHGRAGAAAAPAAGLALVDPGQLRSLFGAFATGVTVVTVGGDHPHGMTANAFTSVSLDPPLGLVCVQRDARLHQALAARSGFGVSILAAHQQETARWFSHRGRPPGLAQFASVGWTAGWQTGAPLIQEALAWFECTLWDVYEGGDHSIFLGRLVSMERRDHGEPLIFYGGQFRELDRKR